MPKFKVVVFCQDEDILPLVTTREAPSATTAAFQVCQRLYAKYADLDARERDQWDMIRYAGIYQVIAEEEN